MPRKKLRRWFAALTVLALAMVAISMIMTRVMASARVHQYLTPRFARAFGRNVEVKYYDFRWLPTPGIVAHEVTIEEDPRFGQEYFLRAQSVTASPRWSSLLAGRLELGTLELSQPSLNLVRNADGRWNVENWLPTPKQNVWTNAEPPRAPREAARLTRIVIDGGRINFSRGIDRRPFALVDVAGSIEQESPGRWQISLEARPIRATVRLQDTGLLRLTGNISGTTARLQPAMLTLTWSRASLADALRLTMGYDHGVRGNFDLELMAWTSRPPGGGALAQAHWEISLGAHVGGLHRWDMPTRDDNPQVSVRVAGGWQVGNARFDLTKLVVEGPNSNISGAGTVDWSREIVPDIRVWSPGVSFVDLVSWYRAFQSGVADGITANGSIDGFASLHGWPLRPDWGSIDSDKLSLQLPGNLLLESSPVHMSAENFSIQSKRPNFIFLDTWSVRSDSTIRREPNTGKDLISFKFGVEPPRSTAGFKPNSAWKYSMEVAGELDHSERLLGAAKALGRTLNNSWDAEGGLNGSMKWEWKNGDGFPKPTGGFALYGFAIRFPFMTQPIQIANETMEIKGSERHIEIASATAFGAKWHGTILRRDPRVTGATTPPFEGWEFDLTADRIDSVELGSWIGARVASIQTTQSAMSAPAIALRAQGNLHVDTVSFSGLELQKVSSRVALDGRQIHFSKIDATTSRGSVSGDLAATLDSDASYKFQVVATKLDASSLFAESPTLSGRLSGQFSGEGQFFMHGIGRANLINSLEGRGSFSAARAVVQGLDLSASAGEEPPSSSRGQYSIIAGRFSLEESVIRLEKINLLDAKNAYEGKGTIDFGRGLLFQLRPVAPLGTKPSQPGPGDRLIRVTGTVEAPRVSSEGVPHAASLPGPQPATPVTRH